MPDLPAKRPIALLKRVPSTAAKVAARALRPAYRDAPTAFDRRVAVLCLLFLALAALIAPWDGETSLWARSSGNWLVRLLAAYTNIGKSAAYLICALAVMTWASLRDWKRNALSAKARLALLYAQAAYVLAAIALSGLLANVLKIIFGRARPVLFETLGAYNFHPVRFGYQFASFPSGHATTMGALGMILILWFPRLRAVSFLVCLLIASSRVPAGAHYPSDVLAGFGLGLIFSLWLARILARRKTVFVFSNNKLLPVLQFVRSL